MAAIGRRQEHKRAEAVCNDIGYEHDKGDILHVYLASYSYSRTLYGAYSLPTPREPC